GAGAPGADAFTADGLGAPGPGETVLDHWWRWCLSPDGRATAHRRADDRPSDDMLDDLMEALRSRPEARRRESL
ncbi:polysaccharide pyruvyl transferase family protein, partial [Dietzia cinnamea]|nr:polysaccharide pyruvyl transferase family protein [Dietzia cinnamea]